MSFAKIKRVGKKMLDEKRINRIIRKTLLKYKQTIIDTINQNQLYNQGIRGDGVKIHTIAPYSNKTKELKRAKNQVTNRVTLDDTGEKYRKSKIKSISEGIEIYSTVDYFSDLEGRYGEAIFKLTEKNAEDFTKTYIIPDIVAENTKLLR